MIYYSCKGDRTMEIKDYDKDRATVLNAFYCSVKSALEMNYVSETCKLHWIADDFKVAKDKLEKIEAEMRVLLGDPFAEEAK
jgi:hypothetical protein